jgi:glycosyltransferase involved in cell wall biosynthesis
MTKEYQERYNRTFVAFHNPVEIESWFQYIKSNFELDENNISVLYAGRIGIGITESLIEVASAIEEIRLKGKKIKLYIQTTTSDFRILKLLRSHESIVINPTIDYVQIPKVFSSADILLLANDFNPQGITFLRLSMPTKATEYLISGTPVFIYAPKESAVSRFFLQNECGFCVSRQNKDALIMGFEYLISNMTYRKKISQNAVKLAKEKYEAKKVRKKFHQLLIDISNKNEVDPENETQK